MTFRGDICARHAFYMDFGRVEIGYFIVQRVSCNILYALRFVEIFRTCFCEFLRGEVRFWRDLWGRSGSFGEIFKV